MADFANVQGLNAVGGTAWQETIDSGPVITGAAETQPFTPFGKIRSGALETSMLNLTQELVGLIHSEISRPTRVRSKQRIRSPIPLSRFDKAPRPKS